MIRMNIMMPDTLALHLKTVPNKSRYIAEALEEKIQRERSKGLRAELAQAYRDSAMEDRAINREWDVTLSDGGGKE